jgi:hypothetical protein
MSGLLFLCALIIFISGLITCSVLYDILKPSSKYADLIVSIVGLLVSAVAMVHMILSFMYESPEHLRASFKYDVVKYFDMPLEESKKFEETIDKSHIISKTTYMGAKELRYVEYVIAYNNDKVITDKYEMLTNKK